MGTSLSDVDALVESLSAAARSGDSLAGGAEWVGSLCGEVAHSSDPKLIAATRARMQRLMGRLERAGNDNAELRGALVAEMKSLGVALTKADMTRVAERRWAVRASLKSRILQALNAGASRPRALAAELGVDESQVSRAFRDLVDEGRIEPVTPPASEVDGRAHWYALRESRVVSAAATVAASTRRR